MSAIRVFLYFVFLGTLLGILWIISNFQKNYEFNNPTTSELAIRPDYMILNATHYFKEHQILTSIDFINKAINAMRIIESELDAESIEALEEAIEDLNLLKRKFENENLDGEHMKHAFFNALNSLAFAQIRISENYHAKGAIEKSSDALAYAMNHIENAMKFAEDEDMVMEHHLYNAIDSLRNIKSISNDQLIRELDQLMAEMDDVMLK